MKDDTFEAAVISASAVAYVIIPPLYFVWHVFSLGLAALFAFNAVVWSAWAALLWRRVLVRRREAKP